MSYQHIILEVRYAVSYNWLLILGQKWMMNIGDKMKDVEFISKPSKSWVFSQPSCSLRKGLVMQKFVEEIIVSSKIVPTKV